MDRKKVRNLALLGFFLVILIMLVVKFDIFNKENIEEIIIQAQEKGSKFFIPIVTALLVFFVPLGWFILISSLLFEWNMVIYIIISAILASIISFFIAKIFRKSVRQKLYELNNKKNRRIDLDTVWNKLEEFGINYIIFIRSIPIVPYTLVNYIAGVSNIGFKDYFLGTIIGLTPTLVINTYFFKSLFNISQSLKKFIIALLIKISYMLSVALVQRKIMKN